MITGVLVSSFLLLVFLTWKEIKRVPRINLALRLLFTIIAVASLVCMLVPPTYRTTVEKKQQEVHLVTEGSDLPADSKKFTNNSSLAGKFSYIASLEHFIRETGTRSVRVSGAGLGDEELAMLDSNGVSLIFDKPEPATGFSSAVWPHQLRVGGQLFVQGRFMNPGRLKIIFQLRGLGTTLDSVAVTDSATAGFRLACTPSHTGRTIYELVAVASDGKTWTEKIPVDLLPEKKIRVLVLSSSPDFENKFLLTWLTENHYPAIIRMGVSQGKDVYQFLNTPTRAMGNISSSALENMDVVIANDEALAELSSAERSALQSEISKGLGLIVQADTVNSLSVFTSAFAVRRTASAKQQVLDLEGYKTTKPGSGNYQVLPNNGQQSLVKDQQDRTVAGLAISGRGHILLNAVHDTYAWKLSGNGYDYSRFWTLLLNKAARPAPPGNTWKSAPAFPVINDQVNITLSTNAEPLPVLETTAGPVYLSQHRDLPDTWTGRFWPLQKGWQTLSSGDTCMLYIYDDGDWQTARFNARTTSNQLYAAKRATETRLLPEPVTETLPFPKFIFFIAFISACAYLWFEGKKHGV